MFADNYIVRVYRRDAKDQNRFVGLVEIVETQEKKPFNTFDELREILEARDLNATHKQQGIDSGNESR